jgi:hypothetical protein
MRREEDGMEKIANWRVGENTYLAMYKDDDGYYWCLEWGIHATDDFGPFFTASEAVMDAKGWLVDPIWGEEGWIIDPTILENIELDIEMEES